MLYFTTIHVKFWPCIESPNLRNNCSIKYISFSTKVSIRANFYARNMNFFCQRVPQTRWWMSSRILWFFLKNNPWEKTSKTRLLEKIALESRFNVSIPNPIPVPFHYNVGIWFGTVWDSKPNIGMVWDWYGTVWYEHTEQYWVLKQTMPR